MVSYIPLALIIISNLALAKTENIIQDMKPPENFKLEPTFSKKEKYDYYLKQIIEDSQNKKEKKEAK